MFDLISLRQVSLLSPYHSNAHNKLIIPHFQDDLPAFPDVKDFRDLLWDPHHQRAAQSAYLHRYPLFQLVIDKDLIQVIADVYGFFASAALPSPDIKPYHLKSLRSEEH